VAKNLYELVCSSVFTKYEITLLSISDFIDWIELSVKSLKIVKKEGLLCIFLEKVTTFLKTEGA
jgi:hypothetical protein